MAEKKWVSPGVYRVTSEDGNKSWLYEKSEWLSPPTLIEIAEHDQSEGTTRAWEVNQGIFGGKAKEK